MTDFPQTTPPSETPGQLGPFSVFDKLNQALGKTFSSLRNRNYRLFFIGQTISNTGNWLTNVALTLLVLKLTHNSGIAIGFLAACQYGPILLLSAWAGAIADRSDKRKMLLLTQALEMAQSTGLAIFAFSPHPSLSGLYALALCGGTLLAFDNPLRRSFVTEMVPREDLPNAVVLYSMIVSVSSVLGPALAGLLVVTLGYGWSFTFDALSYLVVLVCLIRMRTSELYRQPPKVRAKGEIRAGLRYVLSVPTLWISFIMFAVIRTLTNNLNVTLPLFVTGALHSTGGIFTILFSVTSLGGVVGALLVAHRNLVGIRHVLLAATMLGFATLLLGVVPGVRTAAPAAFLIGMASIFYMTTTTSIIQVEARPDMHGRLLSLQTVILGGGLAIGGPLLGWVADTWGARCLMVFGGAACLATVAFGIFILRRQGAKPA